MVLNGGDEQKCCVGCDQEGVWVNFVSLYEVKQMQRRDLEKRFGKGGE